MDEDQLRDLTERYWGNRRGGVVDVYSAYLHTMLGAELAYAAEHDDEGVPRLRPLPGSPPARLHTLALTVGESFEPLLQSITVYKPRYVALILNRAYGELDGATLGDDLYSLIGRLPRETRDLPDKLRWVGADGKAIPAPERTPVAPIPIDTPTEVFRALHMALLQPEAQPPAGDAMGRWINAIDITGAKKSMITGAFLYAAHSGLPILYVDFDEYSPDFGRPYGYTCKIGPIPDPYTAFLLRDWEEIRAVYNRSNFRRAAVLLGKRRQDGQPGEGLLRAMTTPFLPQIDRHAPFDEPEVQAVERLQWLLWMYQAWDNGDYRRAHAIRRTKLAWLTDADVAVAIPTAVAELGEVWPKPGSLDSEEGDERKLTLARARSLALAHREFKLGGFNPQGKDEPNSIFCRPGVLLDYVHDELAKIGRLIDHDEDYRSALLRAAGLDEFLLKARVMILWHTRQLGIYPPEAPGKRQTDWQPIRNLNPEDRHRIFVALVDYSSADQLYGALFTHGPGHGWMPVNIRRRRSRAPGIDPELSAAVLRWDGIAGQYHPAGQRTPSGRKIADYGEGQALSRQELMEPGGDAVFSSLRNEAVHTHLYPSRDAAWAARSLVGAALDEYERVWLPCLNSQEAIRQDFVTEAPGWADLCRLCGMTFLPMRLKQDE